MDCEWTEMDCIQVDWNLTSPHAYVKGLGLRYVMNWSYIHNKLAELNVTETLMIMSNETNNILTL